MFCQIRQTLRWEHRDFKTARFWSEFAHVRGLMSIKDGSVETWLPRWCWSNVEAASSDKPLGPVPIECPRVVSNGKSCSAVAGAQLDQSTWLWVRDRSAAFVMKMDRMVYTYGNVKVWKMIGTNSGLHEVNSGQNYWRGEMGYTEYRPGHLCCTGELLIGHLPHPPRPASYYAYYAYLRC
jgi:hypothetical protein